MSPLRQKMIRALQLHRLSDETVDAYTTLHVTAQHVAGIRSPLDLLRMPDRDGF